MEREANPIESNRGAEAVSPRPAGLGKVERAAARPALVTAQTVSLARPSDPRPYSIHWPEKAHASAPGSGSVLLACLDLIGDQPDALGARPAAEFDHLDDPLVRHAEIPFDEDGLVAFARQTIPQFRRLLARYRSKLGYQAWPPAVSPHEPTKT